MTGLEHVHTETIGEGPLVLPEAGHHVLARSKSGQMNEAFAAFLAALPA